MFPSRAGASTLIRSLGQSGKPVQQLDQLWKSRLATLVTNLAEGMPEYLEIASLADQIRQDYSGRFLIEFLQNAADQASLAGLNDAPVYVSRTAQFVAVLNAGKPFEPRGLESITSLGLSTKDPSASIGNKGLGFKAVFEVAEAAEIYSAPIDKQSLMVDGGFRFALHSKPFLDSSFDHRIETLLDQLLEERGREAARIEERFGKPVKLVIAEEARQVPFFRFPLPLTQRDLEDRLHALALPFEAVASGSTLVVLRLYEDANAKKLVDEAIDELAGNLQGETLLFLRGVGSITLNDLDRKCGFTQIRSVLESRTLESGSGELSLVETRSHGWKEEEGAACSARWWVCSRTIGDPALTSADIDSEREELRAATKELPGERWQAVESAAIGVALPIPVHEDGRVEPLGADGLFSIGLPTKFPTGTPLWVDGAFYGTISRTRIALEHHAYNRLLFKHAFTLFEALLSELKQSPILLDRQTVTLAFETAEGPVAAKIEEADGLADGPIVLSRDGVTFRCADEVRLPDEHDTAFVEEALAILPNQAEYGLEWPEPALTAGARAVLQSLGVADAETASFLARPPSAPSLLELVAKAKLPAGREFWEPFVEWVITRMSGTALATQHFLPVQGGHLRAPSDKVFLAPAEMWTALRNTDDEAQLRLQIEVLCSESLNLLDEVRLSVRSPEDNALTALGKRLVEGVPPPLVQRANVTAILREVVGPYLRQLADTSRRQREALRLLRLVITWVLAENLTQVPSEALVVPTLSSEGEWAWRSPNEVYFGPGWLSRETGAILVEACSALGRPMLVSWEAFAKRAHLPREERQWWQAGLHRLGVATTPRVRTVNPRMATFKSRSYSELTITQYAGCPIPELSPYWSPYLEMVRHRPNQTCGGQEFVLRNFLWVDGLESEAGRAYVIALILANPGAYEPYLTAEISRSGSGQDRSEVIALWVHAIRTAGWDVIPVGEDGLVAAGRSWLLQGDQHSGRGRRYRALPCVRRRYEPAARLLQEFGVATLDKAAPQRLIAALQDIAGDLGGALDPMDPFLIALVGELYGRLQRRLSEDPDPAIVALLRGRPVPLYQGVRSSRLHAVDLPEGPEIFVNDKPTRAAVLDLAAASFLPIAARANWGSLLKLFRNAVGDPTRVRLVSEERVPLSFRPTSAPQGLLGYLEQAFPEQPILHHVAALLAFATTTGAEIRGPKLQQHLTAFRKAQVVGGAFPPNARIRSYLDEEQGAVPLLRVSDELRPHEVLAATWELVGQGYRDAWASYSAALVSRATQEFFDSRHVTPSDWAEIEDVVGQASGERFEHLKAVAFARWRKSRLAEGPDAFELAWGEARERASAVADLLGAAAPTTRESAEFLTHSSEDGMMAILRRAGVAVPEWQRARIALGQEAYRFVSVETAYESAARVLGTVMRVYAAGAASIPLSGAREAIEAVGKVAPEAVFLQSPADESTVMRRVLVDAVQVLKAPGRGLELLSRFVRNFRGLAAPTIQNLIAEVSRREVDLYRNYLEADREAQAVAERNALLDLASALAHRLGEPVDRARIEGDERVAALSRGWWANRFAVAARLRELLARSAPTTVKRLGEVNAFRGNVPASEVRAKVPELAVEEPAAEVPAQPPEPIRIEILGCSLEPDMVTNDLGHGSGGILGEKLGALASEAVDLQKLRTASEQGQPRVPTGRGGGGRSGWTYRADSGADSEAKELNGLIGEAYVYEVFRRELPEFDHHCWRSGNACRYGAAGSGDDSLGADFQYWDIGGRLSGTDSSPECWIEVKATSGDGDEPFFLTASEWELARECHRSNGGRLYVIVQVARVRSRPSIARVLRDPIHLQQRGLLHIETKDFLVYPPV